MGGPYARSRPRAPAGPDDTILVRPNPGRKTRKSLRKCALAGFETQNNLAERRFCALSRENRVLAGLAVLGRHFEAGVGRAQFSQSSVARRRFMRVPWYSKSAFWENK